LFFAVVLSANVQLHLGTLAADDLFHTTGKLPRITPRAVGRTSLPS
jgi:hypothetical protein